MPRLPTPRPARALLLTAALLASCRAEEPTPEPANGFTVEEATIAEIHQAMEAGELTARRLVLFALLSARWPQPPAV